MLQLPTKEATLSMRTAPSPSTEAIRSIRSIRISNIVDACVMRACPKRQQPLGLALTSLRYGSNGSERIERRLRDSLPASLRGSNDNRLLIGNGRGRERFSDFTCQPRKHRSPCAPSHRGAPVRSVSYPSNPFNRFSKIVDARIARARNGNSRSGWLLHL